MTDDPIGTLLLLAAPLGVCGVFALALFERIVPVLPSYSVFAAIGIAAAQGQWPLAAAIAATVLGSGLGVLAAYGLGLVIGSREGPARWIRGQLRRRDRWGRRFRRMQRSGRTLPFVAQLLPGARIFAPLVGGAVPHDRRRLLGATLAGLSVWNATFVAGGYLLVRLGGPVNVTVASVALVVLACVILLAVPVVGPLAGRAASGAARYAAARQPSRS